MGWDEVYPRLASEVVHHTLMAPTASVADQQEYHRSEKAKALAAIYGEGQVYMYKNDVERAKALEAQAARLLEHAQALRDRTNRFGPDNYPDGAVITFDKTFTPRGRIYRYAAMKTIHRHNQFSNPQDALHLWYTTGPKSPKGYTWDELIHWMGDGVKEVYIVTRKEKIV